MPSSTTTRRRRSSSAASILQPIQTNIKGTPSPTRSPKKSNQQSRRRSDSSESGHRPRRKVSFANPISSTSSISNSTSTTKSASSKLSVQTISLPGESQCVALLERDIFAGFPRKFATPRTQIQTQAYQIAPCRSDRDRRSAGYGMFTTRKIPRGGAILVERPVIVVSSSGLGSCAPIDQLLDSKVRSSVMRLTDVHARGDATLEGIIRTNGLEFELGSRKCVGVFLDTSRVNHSCGPNALWRWDPTSFSITLEAVRPISAGSEITIPYIDCLQPRAERRKQLKSLYQFDCYCQHCDIHWSEPNAAAKSDMNRKELREFWSRLPSFDAWCSNRKAPEDALIKLHLRGLELRAAEGLETFTYKRHIDSIAMCYGALEDAESFRCWMERARNATMEEKTEKEMGVLMTWIEDPRRFPVWGWRRSALAR
ncbi:hypothetical protein V5O48_006200 [Marasmius crinis-equi]|uniref:SET domain-containing protein n=1 Tax=Marasmius crinis-equi TaxID=585013 RepID=A0ABR3FK57_9AGAR